MKRADNVVELMYLFPQLRDPHSDYASTMHGYHQSFFQPQDVSANSHGWGSCFV
jgi:hypothetical protein